MKKYNIFTDYEKQKKLKEIEAECARVDKTKYWVLRQMGIPKSTYYDWLNTGGVSQSKAPKKIWNKTPEAVENFIETRRCDTELKTSERSFIGIASKLAEMGIVMTGGGVRSVLKRKGKHRIFSRRIKVFAIFRKAERFMEVVCIDDVGLTNNKPRELSIFNAIDEYSGVSVGILFVKHRINRYDVIDLLNQIKKRHGRFPKIVRLDNAKAHSSKAVELFCKTNDIQLHFIDKGTPQQNWPVESFNGVLQRDLLDSKFWGGWTDLSNKQKILEDYIDYYNSEKPVKSDVLQRTPNEIATGKTSLKTQRILKIKLMRKHRGQVAARQEALKTLIEGQFSTTTCNLSEMCVI